jgi:DNA polymerase-3 subunit gamma/tau
VVRAIEVLGEALVDIRRAPDPRLVLEVTLVRLASNVVANDTSSLLARLERLESGNIRPRDVTGPIPRPKLTGTSTSRPAMPSARVTTAATVPTKAAAPADSTTTVSPTGDLVVAWPGVVRTLKATQRALYSAVEVIGVEGDTLVVSAPSDMHKKKCLELKDQVHAALSTAAGRPITLDIRVQASRTASTHNTSGTARRATSTKESTEQADNAVVASDTTKDDDDQPVESVVDQIAKQFPGARIVDTSQN